jgi:folate-binding protein YgfZ
MSRPEALQLEQDMPSVHLADRGVVRVSGEDAKTFLDNLITCDLDRVSPHTARFGALLTPQGKILFDFIVFQAPEEIGGGYYLDVLKVFAPDLTKRLGFYKLRAKVAVEDMSETMAVVAGWDEPKPDDEIGLVAEDPRLSDLGWRAIIAAQDSEEFARQEPQRYHARRIALGVPEGGRDFLFGEAFPHEALMDQLRGVDFDKGCYVGQEVVSRMQHRGTARTRIVPAVYEGGFAADVGVEVTAGGKTLGTTGTGIEGRGLLMIRLDRAADALGAGHEIRAGGIPVTLEKPAWIGFPFPGEVDNKTDAEPG